MQRKQKKKHPTKMSLVCVGVDVHDICKTLPEDVLLGVFSFPGPIKPNSTVFAQPRMVEGGVPLAEVRLANCLS